MPNIDAPRPISSRPLPAPSPEGVEEFRRLFEERFGRLLTEAEALDAAGRYLLLYHIATDIPPVETKHGHTASFPSDGPDSENAGKVQSLSNTKV